MKTLEKGRGQHGWASEFTCTGHGNGNGGCGAKLLVEEGDLYYTYSFDIPNNERHVTFTCQECGVETDLTYSKYPPSRISIPDKHKWLAARD